MESKGDLWFTAPLFRSTGCHILGLMSTLRSQGSLGGRAINLGDVEVLRQGLSLDSPRALQEKGTEDVAQ